MGPTAAGKTAAAMALADQIDVALISVDSALVYRDMNIGTAKPSSAELHAYPHQLINIRDPHQSYCVAQFITDASLAINTAHQQQKLPVLVGGTLLYFKALLQGLNDTPSADPILRAQIQAKRETQGLAALHQWLTILDPLTAQRLHVNDQQRIERALEVVLSSGDSMSEHYSADYFKQGWDINSLAQAPWTILPIAFAPKDKQLLHPLIEQRFDDMIHNGFLDEVDSLMQRSNIQVDSPAMRCVGYRQAWQHLLGNTSLKAFNEQGKAATRQLAKRQMTWLRHWTSPTWIDPFNPTAHQTLLQAVQTIL